MKKIFFILLVMTSSSMAFSQAQITPASMRVKAKKQNGTGWVILGTGFGLSTVGLFLEANEAASDIAYALTFQERKHNRTGSVLMISGGAIMLGSLPFFIASSRNKKMAATVFLGMESKTEIVKSSFIKTSFPAVSIRLSL